MKSISITGKEIVLNDLDIKSQKGISIGDTLSYRFYCSEFHGVPLLFAEPKGNIASPRVLALTAENLYEKLNLPVVFLLPSCPAYQRQRLIDKEVFFVISDKYAHLPMLVANERIRKTKQAKIMTPVAQYLLLYHLQIGRLEGLTARDIEGTVPYSYTSITLGITCLSDLQLCQKVADGPKRRVLHFELKGKELWEKAQPYMINPVEQKIFCDEFLSEEHFPVCGINALAHYTMLNPDSEKIIMMSHGKLRELMGKRIIIRPNEFDGDYIIEAWKYPPVTPDGYGSEYVDRLSLAITLREDNDPRVEGEVERLINETIWKD